MVLGKIFDPFAHLSLLTYTLSACVLLGGALFDFVVNEKVLFTRWPESLDFTRNYWQIARPTVFYNTVNSVLLVSGAIALVILWLRDHKRKRNLMLLSMILIGLAQLLTAYYFVPQNDLIRFTDNRSQIEREIQGNVNLHRAHPHMAGMADTMHASGMAPDMGLRSNRGSSFFGGSGPAGASYFGGDRDRSQDDFATHRDGRVIDDARVGIGAKQPVERFVKNGAASGASSKNRMHEAGDEMGGNKIHINEAQHRGSFAGGALSHLFGRGSQSDAQHDASDSKSFFGGNRGDHSSHQAGQDDYATHRDGRVIDDARVGIGAKQPVERFVQNGAASGSSSKNRMHEAGDELGGNKIHINERQHRGEDRDRDEGQRRAPFLGSSRQHDLDYDSRPDMFDRDSRQSAYISPMMMDRDSSPLATDHLFDRESRSAPRNLFYQQQPREVHTPLPISRFVADLLRLGFLTLGSLLALWSFRSAFTGDWSSMLGGKTSMTSALWNSLTNSQMHTLRKTYGADQVSDWESRFSSHKSTRPSIGSRMGTMYHNTIDQTKYAAERAMLPVQNAATKAKYAAVSAVQGVKNAGVRAKDQTKHAAQLAGARLQSMKPSHSSSLSTGNNNYDNTDYNTYDTNNYDNTDYNTYDNDNTYDTDNDYSNNNLNNDNVDYDNSDYNTYSAQRRPSLLSRLKNLIPFVSSSIQQHMVSDETVDYDQAYSRRQLPQHGYDDVPYYGEDSSRFQDSSMHDVDTVGAGMIDTNQLAGDHVSRRQKRASKVVKTAKPTSSVDNVRVHTTIEAPNRGAADRATDAVDTVVNQNALKDNNIHVSTSESKKVD